jgi:putative redox protein
MTEVVVRGDASGFAQEIEVRGHRLRADEPASSGGTNLGPNPYDLLLAALGTCTSMTVSGYARRKLWPLERVTVRLQHGKIHAEDCDHCETKVGMLDRIGMQVELVGPLTDDQRARLLQIARICPVHRSLASEIDIQAQLVPQAVAPGAPDHIATP